MSERLNDLAELRRWMSSPRFAGTARTYTAEDVLEQRGTIRSDYTVARVAAEGFYARLRELFAARRASTTFGPYSPGQAVAIKRAGIEGIYLGGWATSAKGSIAEDPGPDLASYPLSQVPDEAAALVRALLAADKNQHFARSRMNDAERAKAATVDFRPFIIADADTGHGGDAHVRNLIRRFVEIGVPGYHIEDQKPGAKKCGHQAGKVLVAQDEQNKRLNAARFQLDIMGVPGILVARTDAEAATLIDSRSDERDQPFMLGATNLALPTYKAAFLALIQRLHELGADNIRGHLLYALSSDEYAGARTWLESAGLSPEIETTAALIKEGRISADAALESVGGRLADAWQAEAGVKTYARAVADVIEFRANEGEHVPLGVDEWMDFARHASFFSAREKARSIGVNVIWSCEHPRTPEGYYAVDGSVEYAIAKSLGVAPFADILWMETKTADLTEAAHFAKAIHAKYPDKMLAYNLSPSFSWDTTGMSDEQMRNFPIELGKLGFVFNFITYGGHQIDGLAGEEFAQALREDGMLALARLQRKLRLLESPYRTPQTLVGGPRADAGLMASSGRTATTKAMGKGSTQVQHLVQTELPPKVLREWIDLWSAHYKISEPMRVELRPHTAGSELLELSVSGEGNRKLANIIFGVIQDRRGSNILLIRDQNTLDLNLRKKRLATLMHLFLIQRYRIESIHYVSPTDDNQAQCARMKAMGIYRQVNNEVGEIIVATVNPVGIQPYLAADRVALKKLIAKQL